MDRKEFGIIVAEFNDLAETYGLPDYGILDNKNHALFIECLREGWEGRYIFEEIYSDYLQEIEETD